MSDPIGSDDFQPYVPDLRGVHDRDPITGSNLEVGASMTRRHLTTAAMALAIALIQTPASAQSSGRPTLHVNPRWKECSFQLDPSLTQTAWRQFTQEAGLVAYFRPLSDARPMGKGHFELSLLQWKTGINDADAAWNDTFVHPDSSHWLFEGDGLSFPGLMVRAGVTGKTDVGLYLTKSPGANYGFVGGQVQHSLVENGTRTWSAAARASFVTMYGPDDLNLTVYGVDVLASRKFTLTRWATVSPYGGASTYLSSSHEKTPAVNLDDEHVVGAQAMMGASVQLSMARLAVEYNVAKVPSGSFKVGIGR
jgi:hypothetical protein